jgi:hypothetical protein
MLIEGLHEAAAALENLAEGRPPDPIRMVSDRQAPKGLWFEHIAEFNVLFEAMTTLEMVARARDVVELESFSELSSLPKSCALWRATPLWERPMGHAHLER